MRKFKTGDIVKLVNNKDKAARLGATAKVVEYAINFGHDYVDVEWINNDYRCGQCNGRYYEKDFVLFKEVSFKDMNLNERSYYKMINVSTL